MGKQACKVTALVLLDPPGALVVMMVYYMYIHPSRPLFQIFTQSIDSINVTSVTLSRLNISNAIDVLGIYLGYLWDIFGISWGYVRDIFGISWEYLGISWGYLGDILGTIGPFVHWPIGPLVHWSIGPLVCWSI